MEILKYSTNKKVQYLSKCTYSSYFPPLILPMYVNPSVLSEDELSACLTRLGLDSASSSEWHLFLPSGMYSRGSGPLLGSRAAGSTHWAAERQKHKQLYHFQTIFLGDWRYSALIQNSILHIKVLHGPCFKDWSLTASRITLFCRSCPEGKLHVGLDQLTFLHLWNCRRLDSSDERPGIFLCCKLLQDCHSERIFM